MGKLKDVNDLIRIGDAIAVLCRKTCHPGPFCPDAYCDEMWDEFDSVERIATGPERKTGKWINAYPDIEPNPMFMYGICSECGFEQSISDKLNYCPNCGAKMVGEKNEQV